MWVYYADRKPTAEDADADGDVLVCGVMSNTSMFRRWDTTDITGFLAWMTPPPLPLVGKTEPIPCRVRNFNCGEWFPAVLRAIDCDKKMGFLFFVSFTDEPSNWVKFCEIEFDA